MMHSKALIARFVEANMGTIWGRQDPGRPHVGPMNFVIWGRPVPGKFGNQLWNMTRCVMTVLDNGLNITLVNRKCMVDCFESKFNWTHSKNLILTDAHLQIITAGWVTCCNLQSIWLQSGTQHSRSRFKLDMVRTYFRSIYDVTPVTSKWLLSTTTSR